MCAVWQHRAVPQAQGPNSRRADLVALADFGNCFYYHGWGYCNYVDISNTAVYTWWSLHPFCSVSSETGGCCTDAEAMQMYTVVSAKAVAMNWWRGKRSSVGEFSGIWLQSNGNTLRNINLATVAFLRRICENKYTSLYILDGNTEVLMLFWDVGYSQGLSLFREEGGNLGLEKENTILYQVRLWLFFFTIPLVVLV